MDTNEWSLSKKVQNFLEGSQNISFLNEVCQKLKAPLPEWKSTARPQHGSAAMYLHGMQLIVLGQKFEVTGVQSKVEAKKACASAAISYFEEVGDPAFVNREHNYTSLLFQLCQQTSLAAPDYAIQSTDGGFVATCTVNETTFHSRYCHSKKVNAKDDVSAVAFAGLSSIPSIGNALVLTNPGFSQNASVQRISLASTLFQRPENPPDSRSVFTSPSKSPGFGLGRLHQYSLSQPQHLYSQSSFPGNDESLILQPIKTQSPQKAQEEGEVESEEDDETPISFVDLLWEYYESKPEIGKPFYNSRTISKDGKLTYKSQLIVGVKQKVSSVYDIKAEAEEDVAKQMFIEIHPEGKEIVENLSKKTSKKRNREPEDEDEIYFSDHEKITPSYEFLVKSIVRNRKLSPPKFSYSKGQNGFFCTGSILLPNSIQEHVCVSLREHSQRYTAREDVCKDIYALLIRK